VGEALGAEGAEGAPPHVTPTSGLRSENEPPRPPLGCKDPRVGGLYPRGPAGGTMLVRISGLLCADTAAGPLGILAGGDLAGAVKLRLALGPVGGLKLAGPRGGERGFGERGASFGGFTLTGDRSCGVDLGDSLSLWGSGECSRVVGESAFDRSLRLVGCCRASLLGWTGGEDRRELVPDVLSEDLSIGGAGEGERRLQVSEVGPLVTRSSRRRGLLDRGRQPPLGPVGGDLLGGSGDLALGGRLSYGDLDLDLRLYYKLAKYFI
jgi:hypothetical protein